MSTFNNRELFALPPVDPIQSFKNTVLTYFTNCEHSILRICKVINTEFQQNPQLKSLTVIISLILIVGWILRTLGARKHSFYRREKVDAAEINKCTKNLKAEIDTFRKYVLEFVASSANQPKQISSSINPTSQQTNKTISINLEKSMTNMDKILKTYNNCIQTSNKFNEYFLDEFVKIFVQLKQLKKNKGIRSGTSRKKDVVSTGERKNLHEVKKPKQVPQPNKQFVIQNNTSTHLQKPVEFFKQSTQDAINTNTQWQNPQQTTQQVEQTIIKDQPVTHPNPSQFSNPFSDSLNSNFGGPQLVDQQPVPDSFGVQTLEATEPVIVQDKLASTQIPDDPIISMPTVPKNIKHSLPSLPVKPKKQVPVPGRRPPPPPRR